MPRSVNHVASRAKRKKILKLTRGYFGARKNVWTVAKNTWEKGLTYAYADPRCISNCAMADVLLIVTANLQQILKTRMNQPDN